MTLIYVVSETADRYAVSLCDKLQRMGHNTGIVASTIANQHTIFNDIVGYGLHKYCIVHQTDDAAGTLVRRMARTFPGVEKLVIVGSNREMLRWLQSNYGYTTWVY